MSEAHPLDTYIGQRLRLRRNMLGLSRDQIVQQMGISSQQLQKYEKGVNRISCSRLYELARILGVTTEYFYQGYDGEASYAIAHPSVEEHFDILRAYSAIPLPKERRAVYNLMVDLGRE